ncbi:unnamed protein product [Clonostachys rhizophaga]|uniref:DUF7730 domain-containing protein n=1 Tax=Clonostachys rhizophaga TaxID=160324 RepID=A0A9N9YLK4_9HYPO|nr:unnamed protein product [Clonostachys rhizophaga]
MDGAPNFLNIPAEIRMLIYDLLLDNSGQKTIAIRNQRREKPKEEPGRPKALRRSSYNVLERTFYCRAYEATYGLASSADLHPAILAVNRRVRQEASHHLYGRHAFHFGEDLEAVGPFIEDKTWSTRALVRDITLHKSGLASTAKTDSCDWGSICRSLGALPKLRTLRLLSVSDLRLLYATRHEVLEWVRDLAQVGTLEELEIVASRTAVPTPTNNTTFIFAAFSASIETSLIEFLNELDIPAVAGMRE